MADIPAIPDSLRDALRRKARLPADYYGDAIGQIRAAGFTVSGLASLDQVQDVLDSLRDALAKGQSFGAWKKSALASGKDFGLAPHRLETIFRNNVQAWYAAGQAEAIRRNKDAFPYLRYSAVGDARTRPAHMALDGLILPVDHPFWRTNYPPCGHNCRCTVIPMTEKAALAAIGAAREEGRVIDQVPADAAPPPPGWDYDRLQIPPPANPQDKARWRWSERDQTWKPVRRAPLEGLERAVERRQAVCVPKMFARDRSHSLWCHGVGVEVLQRYGTSLRRDEPMPDPQRLAQTLDLPQGMKPEEYIAAFMAEFGSGAKGTMSEDSTQRIAALESELAKVKEEFAASTQRAETAEAALAGIKASARVEQIKTLFAAMGRQYSDEAAKPYLQIDDTAFAVVLDDLSKVAKSAPAHLFSEQATQGAAPAAAALDPTTIYAARAPGRKE